MPIAMDQHVQIRDVPRELSSERSELELLTQVAEGDRAAFQQLYTMYYHPLLNFIRRLTGRLDLAEEGVNDVMLVVWTNGGAFAGRSKVSTWIWAARAFAALVRPFQGRGFRRLRRAGRDSTGTRQKRRVARPP